MIVLEVAPLDWTQVGPLVNYIQDSEIIRRVFGLKSKMIELRISKLSEGATIKYQNAAGSTLCTI